MSKITVLKGSKIGFPYTPSRWVGEPEYRLMSRIILSYGGGLGGARKELIVERIYIVPSNAIMEVVDYLGNTIKINTRFVVMVEDYTLVERSFNSSNDTFSSEGTVRYLIPDGETVRFVNKYHEML